MSVGDINRQDLVVRPVSEVMPANGNTGSVLARMTGNALAIVRNKSELIVRRHRIGDYEFRDPDYRQIVLWAEALGITPEDVVARIEQSKHNWRSWGITVQDGAIVQLAWDFEQLPIEQFDWVAGLQIRELIFQKHFPGRNRHLRVSLDKLESLKCREVSLASIDLSGAPALQTLDCGTNELRHIDLTHSKCIRHLDCGWNADLRLELPYLPSLKVIECSSTSTKQLNLLMAPNLRELYCAGNDLTTLDLTGASELVKLECEDNKLRELDLSPTPKLVRLSVTCNALTSIDLSPLQELRWLTCWGNKLSSLDLSHSKKLEKINCADNPLTSIDLRAHPYPENVKVGCDVGLKVIWPSGNEL